MSLKQKKKRLESAALRRFLRPLDTLVNKFGCKKPGKTESYKEGI